MSTSVTPDEDATRIRLELLVAALGSRSATAQALGVERSRLDAWLDASSEPEQATVALILNLDYVVARARLLWAGPAARAWLHGVEPFLNGASPIHAVRTNFSAVVTALDAIEAGSFS